MPAQLPLRLRAFLGLGGVESFHRIERVVDSIDSSGGRSDDELREFCERAADVSARELGQRAFRGQLIAALALLGGHGVQLATGEGKTLAGAIAAAGYALQGRHIHLVSVNDYLARRDAEWMAPLFRAFGVTVASVTAELPAAERRRAYDADVVYVSAAELGFDLLRDRFRIEASPGPLVRPDVAIVDEVDAVLVDEASLPLVLATEASGGAPAPESERLAAAVAELVEGEHFEVDTDRLNVSLTERGTARLEQLLRVENLYDSSAHDHLTAANLALHARTLVHRDVDYLVRDGRLELVSPSRGRVTSAQRWPDGLQEAIEVKEGLGVSAVSEVLDSLTVRALMKAHRTVCGMSGTALAVAPLLAEGYGFTTGEVASRVASRRIDHPDRLFRTSAEKHAALTAHVRAEHATGRPVLIGTSSVAASERLAEALERVGVVAEVLNARNDAEEAAIIARAGEFGRVTISTQMAGRGTDIRLGGPEEGDRERIVALGGLAVIGAERYENRRLDDQLRGRAGRQGDPGSSVFFASLEDAVVTMNLDLVSDSPSDSVASGGLLGGTGLVDHAQRVGESSREQVRASTLRFAETPTRQRAAVMRTRDRLLQHGVRGAQEAAPLLSGASRAHLTALEAEFGAAETERYGTRVALYHLDEAWCRHAALLVDAREGIHLRSLARDNPLDQYTSIAQREFDSFVPHVAEEVERELARAVAAHDIGSGPLQFLRPGATWTYMVAEDPFGSPEQRLWRRTAAKLRRFLT